MTYRGQVKNGVVVLEGHPALEEGTIVDVEPVEAPTKPPRGSAEAITRAVEGGAHWQGDPEEMDRLLAELKAMKQAEVRAQLEAQRKNPLDEP